MFVSDEAFNRIQKILNDKENDIPETASLRVFVQGGGCSGLQYGFEIATTVEEDDFVIEKDGIRVVIDSVSNNYLTEATLNYKSSLEGEVFVINNPTVTTTCGCGSSFAM
jgi:iron-sulfur cluster insertion protein